MPTHDELVQFLREYRALPKDRRIRFREAVAAMNEDLKAKRPFRKSLRVSVLGGQSHIYEMT